MGQTIGNKPVDATAGLCLAIVSSCPEDWGGSEELWAQTARLLVQAGHQVHVFKTNVNPAHPRVQALRNAGCTVTDLHQLLPWSVRLQNRILPNRWRQYPAQRGLHLLQRALRKLQPRLTIVSQGNNFDGTAYADVCRQEAHPYVLIAQKAVNFLFPYDGERSRIQQVYRSALRCYFVSRHNLVLTRQQLSLPLPQAEVVFNPFNVAFNSQDNLPFPHSANGFRLACVARLDLFDKGQDMLLEALSRPRWRSRPLHVTFFGAGPHRQALGELVQFMKLADQVSFGGHVPDPAVIWQTHHALLLPSRSEGLPLALVEAMLCGRPAIATDAGGVAELLVDNVTGFLAAAPSVDDIDEALERAWDRRADWPQIGIQAARHARASVPPNAAALFCSQLLNLVSPDPTGPAACHTNQSLYEPTATNT